MLHLEGKAQIARSVALLTSMANVEGFCKTEFWNSSITWHTDSPDFTQCFQNLVLVIASCGVLWILSPVELMKLSKHHGPPTPWGCLNISKVILKVLLLLLCVANIARQSHAYVHDPHSGLDGIVANLIYFVTLLLSLALSLFSRRRGARVSVSLPSFWMLQTVSTLISMYSEIKINYETKDVNNTLGLAADIAIYIISMIQLILSCFAEPSAAESVPTTSRAREDFCPLDAAPLVSRLTFNWIFSLFTRGLKNSLHQDHLIPLCSELKSSSVIKNFGRFSNAANMSSKSLSLLASFFLSRGAFIRHNVVLPHLSFDCPESSCCSCREYTAEFEGTDDQSSLVPSHKRETNSRKKSLLWTLCRTSWKFLLISSILELLSIAFCYLPPYILSLFLDFMAHDKRQWHGYVYAIALYLSVMISSLTDSQQRYYILNAAIQVKASLVSAIYIKVFRLSNGSKQQHNIGQIMNYMSIDAEKIFYLTNMCTQIWGVPLRIALGLYFLWICLGPSCLMGLVVIALIVPITLVVSRIVTRLQVKRMTAKDDRLSLLSEILHGIKVLKLYAWEVPFIKRVLGIREKELAHLRNSEYLDTSFSFLYSTAPFLVALAAFATYVLVNDENKIEANAIFVSLSVINLLRFPLSSLSVLLSVLIQSRVSISRIQKFLNSEELDFSAVGINPRQGDAITMENGTFSWSGGSEASLKNISLNVPQSSLVAIVGEVGSGKSSLLSALLGDMNKMDGKVNINGSLAYVSQQAWIQNATLQQNILFTSNMEQWKYEKVIEVCALKPDLDILPAGDQTEIGEKGINLSGGQKQRVSLARAVYRNADIYLLDDPLSAVDSNVASHLFQHVIGPEGLLQQKTRLLVTHNLSFLPETDWIVYLKDGAILEQGPYADLMEKRRHFAEFIESNEQKKKKKEKEEAESQSWTDVPLDATDECACNHAKAKEQQEVGFDAPKVNPGQLIEDEQIMSGKALWRVYLGYAESIGYFFLVLSVMAAALYCICEMASGVWLSDWSSDRKETIKGRNFRLTIYGVFILGQGVSIVVSAIILFTGATLAASQLHQCLVHRIMRAPQAFFDITPVGRILNRFSKDLESMDVEIPRALNFWLCSALWIPGVFVVISLTSPYVTIAFLPLLLLYYGIQKLYVTTSRQLRHLTSTTRSPLYSHFSESLSGTSVIRAFKAQDHFVNISHDRLDTHLNCSFLSIVASRWLEVCLNILGGFIVLITAILAVVERHQNPGLVGLALVYALQISQGLSVLVKISSQLETSIVALERIKEYSQVRQEAEWENPITRPPSSWPEEGAVSIQDLSTAYREGHSSVLHNITLTVKPGEKVGIVGRTGAGKSTLALTLFRIIEPTSGSIYIDNVSILCLGLHDLRSKLTIIPQDPVIFCGTLRSNLDPFESHRDAELWAALELAHLKTYVAQLEGGLDYRLTEGGENLSVGQRQLVCLSRALLRKSKVLVLDEATTSLDLETDRLIQQTIGEVFARSTVITIAHRLHTVLDYDRIIVLACGEVVQDGSPKELLRDKDSTFYRLAIDAGIVNEDSVDGFTPELNS